MIIWLNEFNVNLNLYAVFKIQINCIHYFSYVTPKFILKIRNFFEAYKRYIYVQLL